MILWLTTAHENDAVIPLLAKEGPGVVDCWATTPYPSSFGGGEPFSWQRGILLWFFFPSSDPPDRRARFLAALGMTWLGEVSAERSEVRGSGPASN